MGFDPIEVLIIPRVLALDHRACRILTFISERWRRCSVAVLVAWGLRWRAAPTIYLAAPEVEAISISITFLVGMIKAPFMALVIGLDRFP
jgi:phospholipid/cholesterol/gamma-HCH transport system permease protein